MKRNVRAYMWLVVLLWCFTAPWTRAADLPEGFVYLDEIVPGVVVELRYFTGENFVGERIDGYRTSRCICTRDVAMALKRVQADLERFHLEIKVYDAYRPKRAVNHFVRWARDLEDTRMKAAYYPDVAKKDLFAEGYIAARSSHTRGSAVDLTIVAHDGRGGMRELDMGSGFDFFGPSSWPVNASMTPEQRAHRMLLREVMVRNGFEPYPREWWHFMLEDEPFPDTYFDFPVE